MMDLRDKGGEQGRVELRKKLDARGRRRLDRGDVSGRVEFSLRTETEVTPEQREELERGGCQIHFETGNVLSAAAAVERLEGLASLPFVRRIELSRTMFQERSESLRRKP